MLPSSLDLRVDGLIYSSLERAHERLEQNRHSRHGARVGFLQIPEMPLQHPRSSTQEQGGMMRGQER